MEHDGTGHPDATPGSPPVELDHETRQLTGDMLGVLQRIDEVRVDELRHVGLTWSRHIRNLPDAERLEACRIVEARLATGPAAAR